MKTIKIFVLLMFCSQVSAQDRFLKVDGTSVSPVEGSIEILTNSKKVSYLLRNETEKRQIKFKELSLVAYKDHLFQTFKGDKKRKGYFILTKSDDRNLAVVSTKRIITKGGFESPYTRYEMVITDKGVITDRLIFSNINNAKNSDLRLEAIELIKNKFADCPILIERLNTFESAETNLQNGAVTKLLDNPYLTSCQ